jgi:hypothetical protein
LHLHPSVEQSISCLSAMFMSVQSSLGLRNLRSAIALSVGAMAVELLRVESDEIDVLVGWLRYKPTRGTSRPNTVPC